MTFQKNQILNAKVIDLNIMGLGVAKIDGAVVFVQNAVPGDEGTVRIIKCAKNYYIARIEELKVTSSDRVAPVCSAFKKCGGCQFQHISYPFEKLVKKRHVENCLKKAGLANVLVTDVLSTEQVSGYRNKAQFPVTKNENGDVVAGFYSTRTHNICPVKRCDIQDPAFEDIVSFLCQYFTDNKIKPYIEETDRGLIRHIYLRRAKNTGEIMLCLVLRHDSFPDESKLTSAVSTRFSEIQSIVFNFNKKRTNVILGEENRLVWGKEKIQDILCDKRFHLSPLSFYQVNHDAAELLYRMAFQMAKAPEHDLILDLYCGIGSISLSIPEKIPTFGVEIIPDAVKDANDNAKLNKGKNAHYVCGDAKDAFRLISENGAKNPLLIVDPPRKGLDLSLIEQIHKENISKILYISCNPETLSRDLKHFSELEFQVLQIQPVDMFPRTGHIECIAVLNRKEL